MMPAALASFAICDVPFVPPSAYQPSRSNTELSETSVAVWRVMSPEYWLPKLRTWKISLPPLFGTTMSSGADRSTESGPKPCSSATASVNGLNAEPG